MTTVTTLDIKSFSGVGWNQKPEVKMAGGPEYHEIELETNLLPSQFRVEIILNSDTIVNMTGSQLVMLEQYKKHWVEPGRFVIPLGDLSGNSQEGRMVGGLETYASDNIVMRVHVNAEPSPNTQGAVTLKASALVSPHMQGELGRELAVWLPRLVEVTMDASTTGKNIHDTFLQNSAIKMCRAHFNSANIDRIEVKQGTTVMNGGVIWQRDAGQNIFQLKRRNRAPQTGWFHVDFVESGFIVSDALKMSDVLKTVFDVFVSSAGPIPILLETLEKQTNRAAAGGE